MGLLVDLPAAEAGDTPEYFVNGIARIEEVCGNLRFTLFAYAGANGTERRVKVALVWPTSAVARAAMQSAVAAEAASLERLH